MGGGNLPVVLRVHFGFWGINDDVSGKPRQKLWAAKAIRTVVPVMFIFLLFIVPTHTFDRAEKSIQAESEDGGAQLPLTPACGKSVHVDRTRG